MSKTPSGGPTSWEWEVVEQGVDIIPDGGPSSWSWELLDGLTTTPVGLPTGWGWEEIEAAPFEHHELHAIMSIGVDNTWIEKDLYTLYGVPKGAVAHIVLINQNAASDNYLGARTKGGGANEKWHLTKAEDGYAVLSIFVQTDVDGKIEVFNEVGTDVRFVLIGYLTGCTFTVLEGIYGDDMAVGSYDTWEDENVNTNFGVPVNSVLSVSIQNLHNSENYYGGVRANGSALDRYFRVMHRDDGVGWGVIGCVLVQVDGSGIIEIYKDASSVYLYPQGYFSANVEFTEAHNDTGGIINGSWYDKDLDVYGAPNDGIAAMLLLQSNLVGGYYGGVREDGSSLERREYIREIDTNGRTGYLSLVTTGSTNATIEKYEGYSTYIITMYTGYLSEV